MRPVITFDIGNTRTKYAVFKTGSIIDSGAECEIVDVLKKHHRARVIYSTVLTEINDHCLFCFSL